MKQFIYNHGNGQQDYYVEFCDTVFSIKPVTRHFFADSKWEGINMSGPLKDIMRNDRQNWEGIDLTYSETGLSKEHLMATTVDLDFVLSELYKGTYHEDLCTACKGYCCSEAKTSGDGMPDNVVCALRVFELPYFPEDSYVWIKDDRGIESHTQGGFVAFLKKNADGKCHFLSDTGCTAPVKPLACAQFSCLGSGPFNSEVKGRVGAQLYAKYSNRGPVGQTEGNKYKEVTTTKISIDLNKFKQFIAKLKRKNEKTEEEKEEEKLRNCSAKNISLELDPDRCFKIGEKGVDVFEEDDHELKRIINEREYREKIISGMSLEAEKEVQQILIMDAIKHFVYKYPVLKEIIHDMPEVAGMLEFSRGELHSNEYLLNIFNYIIIKQRSS